MNYNLGGVIHRLKADRRGLVILNDEIGNLEWLANFWLRMLISAKLPISSVGL